MAAASKSRLWAKPHGLYVVWWMKEGGGGVVQLVMSNQGVTKRCRPSQINPKKLWRSNSIFNFCQTNLLSRSFSYFHSLKISLYVFETKFIIEPKGNLQISNFLFNSGRVGIFYSILMDFKVLHPSGGSFEKSKPHGLYIVWWMKGGGVIN